MTFDCVKIVEVSKVTLCALAEEGALEMRLSQGLVSEPDHTFIAPAHGKRAGRAISSTEWYNNILLITHLAHSFVAYTCYITADIY